MSAPGNPLYRGDAFVAVRGAAGARNAAERLVLVFQCYLDDSGTSGLPVVTLAGFLAPLEQWERLEPVLDALLDSYGVKLLHTKEYFKGWSRIKKRSFAEELFSATHGCLYGVSMTMRRSGVEKLPNMSPIGVCFSTIMTRIVTDKQLGPVVKHDGLSFLVEAGNKNNAEIEQFFHKMSRAPTFEGCLRSITFIAKDSCRAIQIADFFAFHSRRHMRNQDRFAGKVALPACAYVEIIKKHGPVWEYGGIEPGPLAAHLDALPTLSDFAAFAKHPWS